MSLYGGRWITQKYVRRYPNSRRTKAWAGKLVHIRTENGIWRPDAHGYTVDVLGAWVLPFEDACLQVSHCGPEKQASFLLVGGQPAIIC